MPKVTTNYCNGCPDCIGCDLKNNKEYYECDGDCGCPLGEFAYRFEGEYFCRECAWEYIQDNLKDEVLDQYKVGMEDFN